MTHDEAREAMPLFVIDADDAQTRAALLAHVAECEACRQALQEFELTADALGRAVPQIQPRPELRQRTLSAILGAEAAPERPRTPLAMPPRPEIAPRRAPVWPQWLAAAAALVAVASLAGLLSTRAELSRMRETLAAWQARVAEAEQSTLSARAELVTHRQALEVMTADDLLQVSLKGVAPAARAEAKVFLSRARNTLIFSARDLPPLPADRTYQLWAIADGKPISAGVFAADASGRGQLIAQLAGLTSTPAALAVTVEPRGGVPSPTGPKYLLGVPGE